MLQRLQLMIPFAKYVTYTYKVVVYLKEIDILHVGELGCCETTTRYLHTYIPGHQLIPLSKAHSSKGYGL